MGSKVTFLTLLSFLLAISAMAREIPPFEGWSQISTDHFTFVYEPRDKDSAHHLASMAETIYDRVASFLGSYPKKLYCVVNGRSDIYENYFHPFPAHISITVSAPTWPWFGTRYPDWLELVFTHELTHAIQVPYESGPAAVLAKVFGPGLKSVPGGFLPAWASEGPAVLAETIFTEGGRGDAQFFEMLAKATALDGQSFSHPKAGSSSPFGPQQRPYVAGYLFASHLYQTYGPTALQDVHKAFVRFPFFGPGRAVKAVTGKTIKEIFSEISASGLQEYAESLSVPGGARATPDVYGDYYLPHVTSRGWILYRSTHDAPPALVLFDPSTKSERVLKVVSLTDPSSFDSDKAGETVVFSASHSQSHPVRGTDFSDLYMLDVDTRAETRLTENEHLWHPTLSPDGGTIVAVGRTGSGSALFTVGPSGGDPALLFRIAGTSVYNPVFSDDGRSLIFTMKRGSEQDIWMLPFPAVSPRPDSDHLPDEFNAAAIRPLTGPDEVAEFFPRVIGEDVWYSSDRDGSLRLYAGALTGTGPASSAALDPIGAYAGTADGNDIIYATYTAKGYAVKRVVDGAAALAAARATLRVAVGPAEQQATEIYTGGTADEAPPAVRRIEDIAEETRYIDAPRLIFWAPLPVYYDPFAPTTLALGIGAYFFADSYLGKNGIEGSVTYDWSSMQPGVDLSGVFGIRGFDVGYGLFHGFSQVDTDVYHQNTSGAVVVAYPLYHEYRFPKSTRLTLSATTGFSSRIIADRSFPLTAAPSDAAMENAIHVGGGIRFVAGKQGARRDFFAPLLLSMWSSAEADVFLKQGETLRAVYSAGSYTQVPSLFDHQVVGIGIDGTYTPELSTGSVRPIPRGGFAFDPTDQKAAFLAGIDYRFNLAVIDLPLPYGFSINQLAGGVFLESSARWDGSSATLTFEDVLFPGMEFILNIGSVSHIPVGIGLATRVDLSAPSGFSVLDDLRVYLFAGRGGFHRGSRPGRRQGRRQGFLDDDTRVSYPMAR
jgi:hypothetical protein